MNLHLFGRSLEPHVRKSMQYLKEAQLARVEHQTAAEHHSALAKMYAERIARIEAEVNNVVPPSSVMTRQRLEPVGIDDDISKVESVVVHPSWASR